MRARQVSQLRSFKRALTVAMLAVPIISVATLAGSLSQSRDDQPLVITAVAPVYPPAYDPASGPMDVDSTIYVEVRVDKTGTVISARPLGGHPLLQPASQRAALRWRFAPTERADVRAVTLAFIFMTVPKTTPDEEVSPVFRPPYEVEVRHRSVALTPKTRTRRNMTRPRLRRV